MSRTGLPPQSDLPLCLYLNHSSWWDPLVGLVLKSEFFAGRTMRAPIDAAMLDRYPMFSRLGFFGVEQGCRRGAVQFLGTATDVLRGPDQLLAVTPQSRFADVRERPVRFRAGLGHLPSRVARAMFVPVAIEYVHWQERLPEILVRYGEPVAVHREDYAAFDADDWTALFERKLESNQDALSVESQRRDPAAFHSLLRGGAGQGGVYDWWRALRARLRGQSFNPNHGGE